MTRTPHHLVALDSNDGSTAAWAPHTAERVRVGGRTGGTVLPVGRTADTQRRVSRATARHRKAMADGVTMLAGGWLVVSPLVLGYTAGDVVWNAVAGGAVVALLALGHLLGRLGSGWFGGLGTAAGVWLLMSALWLTASIQAAWSTWFVGVVVLVVAVWGIAATNAAGRVEQLDRG